MQPTFNEILFKILSISGYPNNKEKFIAKFVELTYAKALNATIDQLPPNTQRDIELCDNNHEKIKRHIPHDLLQHNLATVSAQELSSFLEALSSTLSLNQKDQIASVLAL